MWTEAPLDVVPSGTVVMGDMTGDAGALGAARWVAAAPYESGVYVTEGAVYSDWVVVKGADARLIDIVNTIGATNVILGQQRDQLDLLVTATQSQTTSIQQQTAAIQALANKDSVPPTITLKWDQGATITTSSSYTLYVVASDNSGGPLQMRLNGGSWQAYSSSVSVPLTVGLNEVIVEMKDPSGNVGSAKAGIFRK